MGVGKSTVCRSFWCFSGINGCSYALCEYLECNVGDIMSFLYFQGFCNIFVDFCDIIAYNKNR